MSAMLEERLRGGKGAPPQLALLEWRKKKGKSREGVHGQEKPSRDVGGGEKTGKTVKSRTIFPTRNPRLLPKIARKLKGEGCRSRGNYLQEQGGRAVVGPRLYRAKIRGVPRGKDIKWE